jgi:D-glycero-D-manno-heptose 1,7-bisphosphate phosphatase
MGNLAPVKPSLLLLDRDGILNELCYEPELGTVDVPARPDQVRLTETAIAAVRRINEAEIPCAVVSNQPGIAKGKLSPALLQAVTGALIDQLATGGAVVDSFYYCLHHPKAVVPELRFDCPNRKPRPGLLTLAAARYGFSPSDCWFIGDTEPDMRAGLAAGCHTAWVGSMRCDVCPARRGLEPDVLADNLLAAVGMILERTPGAAAT